MIQSRSLVLILDTNTLPAIIDRQGSSRIDQAFSGWIKALCSSVDPPPRGKIVTIVATAGMIDDYKTGLRRRRYTKVAKTIKMVFNGSISSLIDTGGQGRVRLMLERVKAEQSAAARHVRDPYDRRFLDAVIHAAESKRWKDRGILLVTGDHDLRIDAERILAPRNDKRIAVSDMDRFEDLFAC